MDLKELETMFQKTFDENKDAITENAVVEATAKAIEILRKEFEDKGIDLNKKSEFPKKCLMNTDKVTRGMAPFLEITEEVDNFAKDFKLIAKATKANANITASDLINQKAMNETEDDEGGYLVPEEVSSGIIRYMTEKSIIRGRATVKTTRSNNKSFTKMNQTDNQFGGVTLYVIPESGEITESNPVFGKVLFKLAKIAGLTTITDELMQDNNVGLINYVTTLFGEALNYFEDNLFVNGTGVGEPIGILVSSLCSSVSRETVSTVGIKDLLNMDDEIPSELEGGLVWLMRKKTYNTLRGLRAEVYNGSTSVETGNFLITPDITGKGPGTMLGYKIVKTEKVAAYGSDGDVVLANLKGYGILDKANGGMSVATSMHTRFKYDETQMRFIKRVDGQIISEKAFVKLVA